MGVIPIELTKYEPIPTRGQGHSTQGNYRFENNVIEHGLLDVDKVTFWALVGGSIGGALLLLILVIVFVRRFQRKYRKENSIDDNLSFEDISDFSTSHSAPESRNPSPPSSRSGSLRRQSSRMYRTPSIFKQHSVHSVSKDRQARLVRSLTVESIPDFSLPPERVQPTCPGETNPIGNSTAFQYQQSLLGNVQPDLYRYSEDDEEHALPPSQSGRIWFSIVYDAAVEQLAVKLIKAKYLIGRGKTNAPRDPFVKLYLLPDERTCQQSKVRKKTLTPKFNETFVFQVSSDDTKNRILRLSVYDVDKRRVRHSLGHVLVPLIEIDLTKTENDAIQWRELERVSQTSATLGELNVSLTYIPSMDKIKIVILRARHLRNLDLDSDTGVYIKVQLCLGRKVHKTKKTAVQRGTCEPVYNECLSFTVMPKHLESCNFVVTIVSTTNSRLLHDGEYGKVVLGSFLFARGEELMHWQDMIAQPRTAVAKWHSVTCATSRGEI